MRLNSSALQAAAASYAMKLLMHRHLHASCSCLIQPPTQARPATPCEGEEGLDPELKSLNCQARERYTPLHLAADKGHLCVVKFLVKKNPEGLNELLPNGGKSLPLHLAAGEGHLEVVEFLEGVFKRLCRSTMCG
jgi:hypothetical protein